MPVLFITGDEDWVFPPRGPGAGEARAQGQRGARSDSRALGVLRARGQVQRNHREGSLKTVLITGATGDVGTHLRRELAGKYKLRLSDLRPLKANPKSS